MPLHAAALASLRLQHGGPAPTDPEAVSERLRANSDFSLGTPATSTSGLSNLLYYQHFKVLKFKR